MRVAQGEARGREDSHREPRTRERQYQPARVESPRRDGEQRNGDTSDAREGQKGAQVEDRRGGEHERQQDERDLPAVGGARERATEEHRGGGVGVDFDAGHARGNDRQDVVEEARERHRLVEGREEEVGRVVIGSADEHDAVAEQVVGHLRALVEKDVGGGDGAEGGRAASEVELHRPVRAQRQDAFAEAERIVRVGLQLLAGVELREGGGEAELRLRLAGALADEHRRADGAVAVVREVCEADGSRAVGELVERHDGRRAAGFELLDEDDVVGGVDRVGERLVGGLVHVARAALFGEVQVEADDLRAALARAVN